MSRANGNPNYMGKLKLFGAGLVFSINLFGANLWNPKVNFSGRSIHFLPAKTHSLVGQAKVEIAESEGCEAKVQSSNLINLPENCEFLRGYYSYSVKVHGTEHNATIFSEFFLKQTGINSYIRMVNSPTVVFEG